MQLTSRADVHGSVISAVRSAGIGIVEPDRVRLDGVLFRFSTDDKGRHNRKRNGWGVVFTDGPRPVGAFGDWSSGLKERLVLGDGGSLTLAERERLRIAIEQAKADRAAELHARNADAAIQAEQQWCHASPASNLYPYLMRKGIDATGLRERSGFLLVPLRDGEGKLWNLQRIRADGQKRFLRGGRVSGLYASIGIAGAHLLICEGWATGKSLHAATGLPVAVAFSAGNLRQVARVMRSKYTSARITVCADNDVKEDGCNPGVEAATDAARAIGAHLAIPPISGDFNDYLAAHSGASELINGKTQ
jgi:putative DNA primase/helicase